MTTITAVLGGRMKERGIIFSDAMVRAIIDGTKTCTRRVVKPQPDGVTCDGVPYVKTSHQVVNTATRTLDTITHTPEGWPYTKRLKCPYGTIGDRLWVRETHALDPPVDGTWDYYGYTDGLLENIDAIPERFRNPDHVIYRASWKGSDLRWRPSIFTPRWASRITLEVTNVRVERLQSISEKDAKAEGVELTDEITGCADDYGGSYAKAFSFLWDKINGKTYPWHSNPWVWVIEFTKL